MLWYRRGWGFVCTPFSPIALLPGVLARVRWDKVSLLLVAPFWPGRVWFSDTISLLDGSLWKKSCQEGSPLTSGGQLPLPGAMEVVGVAPDGAKLIASCLSTKVVETILQSRAPSTRKLYALKWKLFTSWCVDRQLDPVNCPVGTVGTVSLAGLTHSTLNVYLAAIFAYHTSPLGGQSVGRNPLVTRFLHSASTGPKCPQSCPVEKGGPIASLLWSP